MNQQYSPAVRWILYIVSFISLLVGVIAGLLLMTQDDQESKDVGKNCLIAAAIGLVFWCLCTMVISVLSFFLSFFLTFAAASLSSALVLLVA